MSKLITKLQILFMAIFCNVAVAVTQCVQNNNKVGLVGLDSPLGTVYAGVSEHDNKCGCASFRFTDANTDKDMALSILLAARMSQKKVRIDLLDSTNCDSAYRVYIEAE